MYVKFIMCIVIVYANFEHSVFKRDVTKPITTCTIIVKLLND